MTKTTAYFLAVPVLSAGIAAAAMTAAPAAQAGTGYQTFHIVVDDASATLVGYHGPATIADGSLRPGTSLPAGSTADITVLGHTFADFDAPNGRHYTVELTSTSWAGLPTQAAWCHPVASFCDPSFFWSKTDTVHLGPSSTNG
jgi:hypothetical protein